MILVAVVLSTAAIAAGTTGAASCLVPDTAVNFRVADEKYAPAIAASNAETLAMFPLSPDGFRGTRCTEPSAKTPALFQDCAADGSVDTTLAIGGVDDIDAAYRLAKKQLPSAERVIAFVPDTYFLRHGKVDHAGYTNLTGGHGVTSLVTTSFAAGAGVPGVFVPVTSHELLHQILPLHWNGGFDEYGDPPQAPPVPAINGTSEGALTIDAKRVELAAENTGILFDRVIALVPTGYLQAHRNPDGSPVPDSANGTTPTLPGEVSLVRAAAVTGAKWGVSVPITNHELGHTFGILGHVPIGSVANSSGYDVGCSRIACEVAPFAVDLMSQSLATPVPVTPPDVWIAKADYATIISATKTSPDPSLLGIVSSVTRDGVVTIDGMIDMPAGRVFRLQPAGSYSVDLLDAGGNILEHDSFEPSFRMLIEGGTDFDTNENIVSPRLPYALSTARVEYRHSGKLLLAVDPLARTLHDAILSLPDRAYEREPAQRRKALLEKVDAFEKMLAGRHLVAARNKLKDDIRDKVVKWIVTYIVGTSELSKETVLERIATLDTRITAQTDYPGK